MPKRAVTQLEPIGIGTPKDSLSLAKQPTLQSASFKTGGIVGYHTKTNSVAIGSTPEPSRAYGMPNLDASPQLGPMQSKVVFSGNAGLGITGH